MYKQMNFKNLFSFWEILIFLFFMSLSSFLVLFYLKGMGAYFTTHKGVKFLQDKNIIQAKNQFEKTLGKNPYDPWSYLNLAFSHDLLDEPDKAFKNYDIVSSRLKSRSNRAVFFSHFNKGELNGRLQQIDKALENYQMALDFRYKEKEIKTNIELMFQNQNQNPDQNKMEKPQKEQEGEQKNQSQDKKKGSEKDNSSQEGQNQSPQSKNKPSEEADSGDQESKSLSDTEQKAILEEVEKQESKTRAKFYKMKKIFGDKTKKDW